MALCGGSADRAVRYTGPAAPSARAMRLTRRPFFVSAHRFRRALKAEVGVLLSMLSVSLLGRRRLRGSFSAEVNGITAPHQLLGESHGPQKKPLFHSWFKLLLMFCALFLVFCFSVSNNSWQWLDSLPLQHHYQKLFNRTRQINLPPSYLRVTPKSIPTTITPTTTTTTTTTPTTTNTTTVAPTGPQYHQAYPRNYNYIIDNTDVCKNKKPFLVLMVPVAPSNLAARDAIRQTWGNESQVQGEVVLTMFMLGSSGGAKAEQEKLLQENLKHHDVIQSDFKDSYNNLTIKTMLVMDWLATRCDTAAYGMKIDSDMFLNVDNLVTMLKRPGIPMTNYLTGYLMWNRPVVRTKSSKWYVSKEMYPDPTYPPYTLGMGYIFSNDLTKKFVEVSKSIKPFKIEDAYVGMCMKKLGLHPVSPPNPSQFQTYCQKFDRCSFSKAITYILGSSQQLVNYWTELKKPGAPCK